MLRPRGAIMANLNSSIAHIPLPKYMHGMALTDNGYPALFFAKIIDGKPDIRVIDPAKVVASIKEKRCWLCGKPLGVHLAFVIMPISAVTRSTGEPPSHLDCALYAMRACPFLTRPFMRRRHAGMPEGIGAPGHVQMSNPGASVLWVTRSYRPFPGPNGGILISVGPPDRVDWWAEGRLATRAEVDSAMEMSLPELYALCEKDRDPADSRRALDRQVALLAPLMPVA